MAVTSYAVPATPRLGLTGLTASPQLNSEETPILYSATGKRGALQGAP